MRVNRLGYERYKAKTALFSLQESKCGVGMAHTTIRGGSHATV